MAQITADQMPALCRNLLAAGRVQDALTVVLRFFDAGVVEFNVFGEVLKALEQFDPERPPELLEKLLGRFPDDARAWSVAFSTWNRRGDYQRALDACERYIALGGDPDAVAVPRAQCLERLFRPEDALRVLEGVAPADQVKEASIAYVRAGALTRLKRLEEARDVLEALLADDREGQMFAACWKMLGRLRDRLGDYPAAMEAFHRGNAMQDRLTREPPHENPFLWRLRASRQVFTDERVAGWRRPPVEQDSPVFLIGFPRSGTTLLEQVLDAHPALQALEEKPTWAVAERLAAEHLARHAPAGGAELSAKGERLRLEQLGNLTPAEVTAVRHSYHQAVARYLERRPGTLLVDKLPLNILSVGMLAWLFPGARFVVALRHPCDAILSNYMHEFRMNAAMQQMLDLRRAAAFYRDTMALLWQVEEVMGLADRVHYLRYEDLLDDFQGTVAPLLDFLGVGWDPAVARYHEHARERGTLSTPSYQGVTQKLYNSAMNRWQRYSEALSPVFEFVEPACHRYGYSLETPSGE